MKRFFAGVLLCIALACDVGLNDPPSLNRLKALRQAYGEWIAIDSSWDIKNYADTIGRHRDTTLFKIDSDSILKIERSTYVDTNDSVMSFSYSALHGGIIKDSTYTDLLEKIVVTLQYFLHPDTSTGTKTDTAIFRFDSLYADTLLKLSRIRHDPEIYTTRLTKYEETATVLKSHTLYKIK